MPGRDGTGPIGRGAMTGRGFGLCKDANPTVYGGRASWFGQGFRFGRGYRCRGGFGWGFENQKEMLEDQKVFLEDRLDAIKKQLEEL